MKKQIIYQCGNCNRTDVFYIKDFTRLPDYFVCLYCEGGEIYKADFKIITYKKPENITKFSRRT